MASTHVALLRGINLAGKNRLPMKELVALFAAAGCEDVRTYIQSGNAIFRASRVIAADLPATIPARIKERFGYRTPVIVRSAAEFEAVFADNPFHAQGVAESELHVVFLADRPAAARVAALDPDRSPGDAFAVLGREVYLHLPNGLGRSKLTNDWFDTKLGTIGTVRNWRTVTTLRELMA
jgi:uncharacterized protein (DUF1697 family)